MHQTCRKTATWRISLDGTAYGWNWAKLPEHIYTIIRVCLSNRLTKQQYGIVPDGIAYWSCLPSIMLVIAILSARWVRYCNNAVGIECLREICNMALLIAILNQTVNFHSIYTRKTWIIVTRPRLHDNSVDQIHSPCLQSSYSQALSWMVLHMADTEKIFMIIQDIISVRNAR